MMAGKAIQRPRLMNTPERVFPWRGRKRTFFPMVMAHLIAAAGFALLLGAVRVRVVSPKPMAPRKASLIYLADDAQGRALALQAQEGGPFPARFEPSQWEGMAGLETQALAASRRPRERYVPSLRELPKEGRVQPIELAAKGETFFPEHPAVTRAVPASVMLKPAPILFPLSGIPADAIPAELPPFSGTVDSAMTSASWRFLVRLHPGGGVAECVSLEKAGAAGTQELEMWLRGIRFHSAPEKPFRWIAVGIGFSNQLTDGPETR